VTIAVTEPTGCRTTFTGVRVTKHDGARQHLIGIQATIPASRTIAGVIAERDQDRIRLGTGVGTSGDKSHSRWF